MKFNYKKIIYFLSILCIIIVPSIYAGYLTFSTTMHFEENDICETDGLEGTIVELSEGNEVFVVEFGPLDWKIQIPIVD